tara:strand:+ start:1349 stop:1690 length:342 start_codon:yes stop_codon:yes gene_type:complete
MSKYKPYSKANINKNNKPSKVYSSYEDKFRWPYIAPGSNLPKETKPVDKKDKKSKKKNNFLILKKDIDYYLVEHQVTNERKWVSRLEILNKEMPNAFYDADYHFSPEGKSKWD